MSDTLSNIGEDALIAEIRQQVAATSGNLKVGIGDDCAVLAKNDTHDTLLKTDSIIEGVHFLPNADAYWVGWKAAARVVSDFAAMGGKAEALLVTIALRKDTPASFVESLYKGIHSCAERYQCSIAGGETSGLPDGCANLISVAGTGTCQKDKAVLRSGAKLGDTIYVTGQLGGSIHGHHLTFTPRVAEAAWLLNHLQPNAMMDLSDGLAKDLPRLCEASGCGYTITLENIPANEGCNLQQAIGDGEDYELLFTSSAPLSDELLNHWEKAFPNTPLTPIGTITETTPTPLTGGFEHFS